MHGLLSNFLLAILAITLASVAPRAHAQSRGVTITYLANMGVLVEGGGKRVVIDGFHHGELEGAAGIPPATLAALESARDPFRTIDVALVTHRHFDHFDGASVAARLRADTAIAVVATAEAVDTILAKAPNVNQRQLTRARPLTPGVTTLDLNGVRVTVLDLPHNRTRRATPANVAYIAEVGGMRILHVGDADPSLRNYEAYAIAGRSIDVAILPSWYFESNNQAVLRLISATRYIAVHVGPDDGDVPAMVNRSGFRVQTFTRPGQRVSVP